MPRRQETSVPVDPHIAAMLTMMDEAGMPPMYEGSPEAGRALYLQPTHGAPTPQQPVPPGSTQDRPVPGAAGDLRARGYPPQGEGPLPPLALFHGGGRGVGRTG